MNYFCKTHHLRCLTGLYIHLSQRHKNTGDSFTKEAAPSLALLVLKCATYKSPILHGLIDLQINDGMKSISNTLKYLSSYVCNAY